MDRNSITGLLLIGAIIIGFSFWMSPSEQEIKELQRKQDSIAAVKKQQEEFKTGVKQSIDSTAQNTDTTATVKVAGTGPFAAASIGVDTFYTVENELIKATLSSKGGRVYSVEVKNQKTWDGKPLVLFNGDKNSFGINFFAENKSINTNDFYFTPVGESFAVAGKDKKSLTLRMAYDANRYIDFVYSLTGNTHLLDFDIKVVGLQDVINKNTGYFDLNWQANLLQLEKSIKNERQYSTIYYKYTQDDEIDYINPAKDEEQKLATPVKWVSFKQHFFSSILIAKTAFDDGVISKSTDLSSNDVNRTNASLTIPYNHGTNEAFAMQFYFGPNHFETLKSYNLDLEREVNLGWGPLKWINRWAVIPVFNYLDDFNLNYGIIILLLTIILKVILFPLTYSSYLSTSKMRILKPEMDEIKEKIGEGDPTKLQQEYMKLYKKAGVNPLGGCLPLLLQMPILFAFFFFFPASFELRQQAFLWAPDLSTYDSIWDFGTIPIIDTIYGDHVSLFCLLMTASTLLYTKMNNQISGATGQMKWMGYLMPIVFLGVLNSNSSGLTYYYFCANMITFAQQWLIRRTVNEEALHKQIQDNKKKPHVEKKSKFQQKLEEMAKARGYQAPKKK